MKTIYEASNFEYINAIFYLLTKYQNQFYNINFKIKKTKLPFNIKIQCKNLGIKKINKIRDYCQGASHMMNCSEAIYYDILDNIKDKLTYNLALMKDY